MIIKKLVKHLSYYLSLVLIFAVGLTVTLLFSPNLKLQVLAIVSTIIFYIFWGILHHKINHELTLKVLIEYFLIGLLGLSIVFFIFMNGVGI